jgi:hypothetical protein
MTKGASRNIRHDPSHRKKMKKVKEIVGRYRNTLSLLSRSASRPK